MSWDQIVDYSEALRMGFWNLMLTEEIFFLLSRTTDPCVVIGALLAVRIAFTAFGFP